MAKRTGAAHVVTTSRTYKGKTYKAHLLRRSYREDGKVKNETLGNLSHLPEHVVELIRRSLRGEEFVEVNELFDIESSPAHGNVQAVLTAMRRLGLDSLIGSRRCRERDLALAMIAARVLQPQSKLATTRWWHETTLPESLDVADAGEDDLYHAMDWLLARQPRIESKLAKRHLNEGGMVMYDLTSSYFEGRKCPLSAYGHNRDRKRGKLQVNYGLVTDQFGCPVSVSVFPGNTNDSTTLLPQVDAIRSRFEIDSLVIVGDRGMISQKQINELYGQSSVDWITALRAPSIRDLVVTGALQLGLFDERNLFEFEHADYPGERLVACRNGDLAAHRAAKRQALLEATIEKLERVQSVVASGKLRGTANIGVRVGRVINAHKVGKLFDLDITDTGFEYSINQERVALEALLDGVYILRTSLPAERVDAPYIAEAYKMLCRTERAFRSMKTAELHVRPIRHWSEQRVRAHIFLCMLAYYVQFHMQEAWRSLLFFDEEAWTKPRLDPVARAKRSKSAERKAREKLRPDGQPVHSFRTLLASLGAMVCNVCRRAGIDEPIKLYTRPSPLQREALELLESISV